MKAFQIYRELDMFNEKNKLPPECREDQFFALQDLIPLCESQEGIEKHLSDWLDQHPHLKLPENVQIPDGELEPCFGDEPSLAATDANLNPGQNPNAAAQRKRGDNKNAEPEVAPSKNPWHVAFKGDRNAAIESVIKTMGSAGAVRMARAAKTPDAPFGRTLSGQPLRK
jgi:hypothetical protein